MKHLPSLESSIEFYCLELMMSVSLKNFFKTENVYPKISLGRPAHTNAQW